MIQHAAVQSVLKIPFVRGRDPALHQNVLQIIELVPVVAEIMLHLGRVDGGNLGAILFEKR